MFFTNPIGLLALLTLPALVVIYCLRRKSQTILTPTLFLIDRSREPDEGGRRLRRFRSTTPFWLQALALLLAALLLAGLYLGQVKKIGRVAIVLDSTASVASSRDQLLDTLQTRLDTLSSHIQTTEFTVLDSYPGARPLYHGTDLRQLARSLQEWQPGRAGHDFAETLNVARSLAGDDGTVILATDRQPPALPDGVALLSVAGPAPNIGFLGVDTRPDKQGQPAWSAVVRNYSDAETTTSWQIEIDGAPAGEPRPLTLPPDGAVTVGGAFPETPAGQLTLVLPGDTFPLDDRLPIVRPLDKQLLAASRVPRDHPLAPTIEKLLASLPDIRPITIGNPDVEFAPYDPLAPIIPPGPAIILLSPKRAGKLHTAAITTANHPLVTGLQWGSLIYPEGLAMPIGASDEVLVWGGDKALVALRPLARGKAQLLFNFDLARSNAAKLPAFAVLCHRFLERLRRAKVAPTATNLGVGQRLQVTGDAAPEAPPLQLVGPDTTTTPFQGRAPEKTGFFQVSQGETTLLTGAAHFADPLEADLRDAAPHDTVPAQHPAILDQARRDSPWAHPLLLLALLAALAAWHFQNPPLAAGKLKTEN